jgi:hypothetical protein
MIETCEPFTTGWMPSVNKSLKPEIWVIRPQKLQKNDKKGIFWQKNPPFLTF